MFQVAGRRERS
ncbi:hypothetical protein U0070_017037 [Myodes glareolus]|uniref:Uncharacterized protein n=1 Tax=Myodes glareolus TaxID=447135 RepID=A0AAW0HQQ7_MYOGA